MQIPVLVGTLDRPRSIEHSYACCLSIALDRPSNKHNCVLSNAGLSDALTTTGICTSLKSDFYISVSFTIEHKVGIAELYLYMGSGADRLKDVVTRA